MNDACAMNIVRLNLDYYKSIGYNVKRQIDVNNHYKKNGRLHNMLSLCKRGQSSKDGLQYVFNCNFYPTVFIAIITRLTISLKV